jgi:hypothetical protein
MLKFRSITVFFALLFCSTAHAQYSTKGIQYANQSSIPCAANTSCMWIDSTNQQVHFYDGTNAKTIPSVIATIKGSIAAFTGTVWQVLAAGSDGQCLQSQSGAATGLQWGSCGGSTGNFTFSANTMNLSGAAAMSIAPTTATSVSIGASSIGTTIAGPSTFTGSTNTFTNGIVGSTTNMSYLDSSGSGVGISASLPQLWVANIPYYQWYTTYFIPLNISSLGLPSIPWTGVYNNGPMSGGLVSASTATATIAASTAIEVATFGGARTITLPAANTVIKGGIIMVVDGNPTATTGGGVISIARTGSDTINGGTSTITAVTIANAHSTCIDVDNTGAWICGLNN